MRNALVLTVALAGCFSGPETFTIEGRIVQPSTKATSNLVPAAPRVITHVMAVNPEAAAPRRTLAAIGADGAFTLDVEVGKPYVFVLVDSTAVGADMAVALFRANTLDTISPQLAGHLDLGDVQVDPDTQSATAGIPYDELIASLGLDPAAAEYLGSVDDLSLRYANPDIDGDGVIDLVQGHELGLDFHVRANLQRGADGPHFTVADITDQFLPDTATPVFNLSSIYVLYPAGFDPTDYVGSGPPGSALQHGGSFSATLADGSAAPANTSFSGLGFGSTRGWGPDYDHTRGAELPGSGGAPATLAFRLGGIGTTLTFTNVVTRTRAALTGDGAIAIFVRLTTEGGTVAAVDFEWRKQLGAGWVAATPDEIAVTIGSDGGYLSIHRVPSWSDEAGISIPAIPSGTIAWPHDAITPDEICGLAVSFDDKLGLRHFVGGVDANPGVTCTP